MGGAEGVGGLGRIGVGVAAGCSGEAVDGVGGLLGGGAVQSPAAVRVLGRQQGLDRIRAEGGRERMVDRRRNVPNCSLQAYIDTNTWGCWAGIVIGMDIVRNKECYRESGGVRRRSSSLIAVGMLCVGAGLALSLVIPIGKQLWTPSFALVTIGITTVGFGVALLAFDGGLWATCAGATAVVRRAVTPVGDTLVALGRNPLFFCVLSELVITTLDYIPVRYHGKEGTAWSLGAEVGLATWLPAPLASMVWALLWLLLFYVPLARFLMSRGWYIRV
ncbi:hypothetical protein [Streptomyces sp. NPDC058412]|uniref:hypothetical protein n=1 Tax=Streptomyces sp. NPDC058412 TaxID=3346486 RepID=UPI003669EE40